MAHDDFATEPVPGLPEKLPEGETILWQGRPDWWALTREALSLWWVMGYFALLAAWRFLSVMGEVPLGQSIGLSRLVRCFLLTPDVPTGRFSKACGMAAIQEKDQPT